MRLSARICRNVLIFENFRQFLHETLRFFVGYVLAVIEVDGNDFVVEQLFDGFLNGFVNGCAFWCFCLRE